MKTGKSLWVLGSVAVATAVFGMAPAQAHFLWAEIEAKPQPTLQLAFAEAAGEDTSTSLIGRLATVRAWDGSGSALKAVQKGNELSAPVSGATPAGAHQTWGVVDKTDAGRGVFLLEYYAKAAPGLKAAGQSVGLPIELLARSEGEGVLVTLMRDGKAVKGAEITLDEPQSVKPREFTTDAAGQISFVAARPGLYGLRAAVADKRKGVYEGKAYGLVRHYSTLTFAIPVAQAGAANATSPGEAAGNPAADPAAYALLQNASRNRQVMPADFAGFDAAIVYGSGAKTWPGTVQYRRNGKTTVSIEGLPGEERNFVLDQIHNVIGHRRGGNFAQGDGRHPLSFGKEAGNEFGKLIELNDRMKSSYRVRDNKVTEVTRTAGGVRFTISVLETLTADGGRYLPLHFIVSYRDEKTGALQKVEGFRDAYTQIGDVWLPIRRHIVRFDNNTTPSSQIIRFQDFKIVPAEAAAK